MKNQILDFIRKVVLSPETPYELRDEALNLLLDTVRSAETPTVKTFFDDGRVEYLSVPYPSYVAMVDFLKQNRLIEAIKEFRGRTGVGLKEAKVSMENLRDQLGIAYTRVV